MLDTPALLSLWVLIPSAIVLIAVSVEVGYRVGRHERRRPHHDPENLVSDLATPTVGLLGLMLAFTFGWSATRFDARRNARLREAQAMARLFRLSDFLPADDRVRIRDDVRRYIAISLAARDVRSFEESFKVRESMHEDLWKIAAAAGHADPHSNIGAQVVEAVNEVLDAHLIRSILAKSSRLPRGILDGLIAILVLTMAMIGYQMGLAGSSRSPALIPLTLALTLVVFLIADLDRPLEGLLRVSDQALYEVQRELGAWR